MEDENIYKKSLEMHAKYKGKWELKSKVPLDNLEDLSLYYSPGVAEPCKEIAKDVNLSYKYTNRGNTIAIVSDGTAVLGLGDIGPEAGLPVMEGKALLYKKFANIDCFPICIGTKEPKEIIEFCKWISPSVAAIHLEDISAPRCIEIETTLQKELNMPVFHDDQHGTGIVVSAGIINACKVVNKKLDEITVVVSGTGAAGSGIIKKLYSLGIRKIRAFNKEGVLHKDNPNIINYDFLSKELVENYVGDKDYVYKEGTLAEIMQGADVFVGVSVAKLLTPDMIKSMARDPIVFALANPSPEIMPDIAKAAGARIIGTGRSDCPNQINNVSAFPGLLKGALDANATVMNEEMITAAVYAIAESIPDNELREDNIIPSLFDINVTNNVAARVCETAIKMGVIRKH